MGLWDRLTHWWQRTWTPEPAAPRRIVVVSDLHLGEEVGEGDDPYLEYIEALNRQFADFVDRQREETGAPMTLVINGDSIDFLRTIVQPSPIEARLIHARPLTPREARLGQDSSREHAVWKLGRVIGYHRPVFDALARFVAAGHELVFIRGNHDVEFYWPEVREAIVDTLVETSDPEREQITARIRFEPWFYYLPGRLYLEHGHQYDPHCSYEDLLDPVDDEGQSLALPYVSWTIRYFAPLLHGAPAAEMEEWSFFDFLRWALGQPPTRFIMAVTAYLRLVLDISLRKSWRHTVGRPRIRARHRRRLARVAAQAGLPLTVVERLDGLKEPPVSERFLGIALAFYVDRFFLLALTTLGMLAAALLPAGWLIKLVVALCVLLGAIVGHEVLRRLRSAEATAPLRERALAIARLLDVPFVSFGHSHGAALHPEHSSTLAAPRHFYLNSGHWVARYARSAFTYLELAGDSEQPRARLMRWEGAELPATELARATPGEVPSLDGEAAQRPPTEQDEERATADPGGPGQVGPVD